jgi:CheY-like chemotaxis protein
VPRKVLVADDSPTVQKRAGGILTGEGYEVVTVSNGVAAVKKLAAVMPLVVLADVAMPGKDGYEVCEFIKKDEALKHVPVVLVFSDTDPIEEDRAARVHADGRVSKPFNPEDLITVVGKFAAMAEAAAEPVAPPPLPMPAPPVYVSEPVDAEPEPEQKQEMPDISGFSGGVAFGDMGAEERFAPAPPPVEPVVEAGPEMSAAEPPFTPPQSPAAPAEPVLVEEAAPAPPPPAPEEQPPAAERTMLFHAPSEIAEPMLSEEGTGGPAPAEPDAPPAEAEIPAATTLESFSLQEAESGHVRFAGTEDAPVAAEPVAPPPAAPKALDESQIFAIVHKVVVRMSPPALSPQTVEDIARRFTDELVQELKSQA